MRFVSISFALFTVLLVGGCSERVDRTQLLEPYLKTDKKPTAVLKAPESTPPLESAQKEFEKNPKSKLAAMRFAMASYRAEDFAEARRILKTVDIANPEGEFLRLLYVAACEEMLELWSEAAESYLEAAAKTKVEASKAESLYLAGFCLRAAGRMKEARTCFERTLVIDASHLNAKLGLFYLNLLEYKDSEAEKLLRVIDASATGENRIFVTRAREALQKVRKN